MNTFSPIEDTSANPEVHVEAFFAAALERQRIYRKKEAGLPPPWTDDPVMQSIYLTNVFREQDKTTVWFRENARGPYSDLQDPVRLVAAIVLFRWFNRIRTGKFLFTPTAAVFEHWFRLARTEEDVVAGEWLSNELDKIGTPIFTSGYMIKPDNSIKKSLSVATAAATVVQSFMRAMESNGGDPFLFSTLEKWTEWFASHHGLGGFMAYEIVTDLRWTFLAEDSTDIMSWANLGPGAARGISRVYYGSARRAKDFDRDRFRALDALRWVLSLSQIEDYWPKSEPRWEMRDVEHWMCEFDKIQRVRQGDGRSKRRYDGIKGTSGENLEV